MSCTKPNIQNLPRSKTYRGCITAEPGSCIVKADYSQIELRIAAVIAQDAAMLEAYGRARTAHCDGGPHLGVPPEQVTGRTGSSPKRSILVYSMAWAPKPSRNAGKTTASASHSTKPNGTASAFLTPTRACGAGSERPALANARNPHAGRTTPLRCKAFTERLNSPVQGTGADGLKLALARLFAHRNEAPDARLVAVIHDEIVVEAPVEAAEATAQWLQHHMTAAMSEILNDGVPVEVETVVGLDWAGTPFAPEEVAA